MRMAQFFLVSIGMSNLIVNIVLIAGAAVFIWCTVKMCQLPDDDDDELY